MRIESNKWKALPTEAHRAFVSWMLGRFPAIGIDPTDSRDEVLRVHLPPHHRYSYKDVASFAHQTQHQLMLHQGVLVLYSIVRAIERDD